MPTKRRRKRGAKRAVDFDRWQWDASTPEQRAARTWRMTERGEIDAETGEVRNPNNVQGVTFLTPVEKYAAQGLLEDRHLDAAWEYERLARIHRGSPAQRSCLDNSPVGYGEPDIPEPDARMWRNVCRALGRFEQAELDRTAYMGEPTARVELLARALGKVADVMGY